MSQNVETGRVQKTYGALRKIDILKDSAGKSDPVRRTELVPQTATDGGHRFSQGVVEPGADGGDPFSPQQIGDDGPNQWSGIKLQRQC